MSDASEPFHLLGLPVAPASPDALSSAYLTARQAWFEKQFDPIHMTEARARMEAIDEAYRSLRDTRRQTAILREAHRRPRPEIREIVTEAATPPVPAAPSRVVNRSKIVRDILRQATQWVAQSKQVLSDEERQKLTRAAFDEGLDYTDAEEVVERVAREVAISVRPLSKSRRATS